MLFPKLKELIKLKNAVNASAMHANSNTRVQGDYTSIFHGLGVEFETIRPYVVGDDVRYIDWRVTARIGKPQVKTFKAECDRNVLVIVDANAYMRFGTRGTFKSVQAARTAAILSWKSLALQDRVGGLVFGDIERGVQYFKPTKHDNSILRMLKVLCQEQINLHQPVPISQALKHAQQIVTPQSLVFIISDFSCDDIAAVEKALVALRRKCTLVLLPVHDPSDSNIPQIGSLIFADGAKSCLVNTDDEKASDEYTNAWQTYTASVTKLSKKLKAPLIWIETAIDPIKSLFALPGVIRAWKI